MKALLASLIFLTALSIVRADLASIENQYRAAYELHVGTLHTTAVADLDVKYIGALERAMASATQGQRLDEALGLRDEIQRVKDKGPIPETDEGVDPGIGHGRFPGTSPGKLDEAYLVRDCRAAGLAEKLMGPGGSVSLTAASAAPEKPFENSLGMRFVPVPITGGPSEGKTIRFSVWETRVKDYARFAKDEESEWPKPDFEQTDDHPAVMVSWEDATAFCEWLTKEERRKRKIGPKDVYRLPTDHEWSCAVGIGKEEDALVAPAAKSGNVTNYPWGPEFPPPKGAGNYNGEETKRNPVSGQTPIPGYNDGFERTAPVLEIGTGG